MELVRNSGDKGITLCTLGQLIKKKFGDFKVRDYGFSQFKQYIQSFPEIEIKTIDEINFAVLKQ